MTLLPGDVIVTGTPEGVGVGMKPLLFLKRGDVMELDGGVLGLQRQKVVSSAQSFRFRATPAFRAEKTKDVSEHTAEPPLKC